MKAKRIFIRTAIAIVAILLCIQFGALLRCEILTAQHGAELTDAYQENDELAYWVDGYDWAKVISYSDTNACVYYTLKSSEGLTVSYVNTADGWKPDGRSVSAMTTLWSTGGNADEVIFPYWYHCFYFLF